MSAQETPLDSSAPIVVSSQMLNRQDGVDEYHVEAAALGEGTDPRQAILAPSDGVLHIGDADYVLIAQDPGLWRVTEVQVGERSGDSVEILGGVKAGQRIIGNGAILLKPLVVQALLRSKEAAAATGMATP